MTVRQQAATTALAFILMLGVVQAQQTDRQMLEQTAQTLEQLAQEIRAHLNPPPPPPPAAPTHIRIACGESIEAAYDGVAVLQGAPAPWLVLDKTCLYLESVTLGPKATTSATNRIRITTEGYVDKGVGFAGLVTPADAPNLAAVQSPDSGPAFTVANGIGAGNVEIVGLELLHNQKGQATEIVLLGSHTETDPTLAAANITLKQLIVLGHPTTGQRRGIVPHARNVDIEQVWIQDCFWAGTDSQAISAYRGGWDVRIRFAYLQAGSENFILGGTPAPAGFTPSDWLLEDVIVHKPLRWQTDGTARNVKNLLEVKHARNVTFRRVLAVNNWVNGQDGTGILVTYATNGQCPGCEGITNVLFEDLVMLNSPAGFSVIGYSYSTAPGSGPPMNAKKLQGLTVRNAYIETPGTGSGGRAFYLSNILGPHDITLERNTFRNNGSQWFVGGTGYAWVEDTTTTPSTFTRVVGAPMQNLTIRDNVYAGGQLYGATIDSTHYGSAFGTWVTGGLQIAGNVYGDPSTGSLNNYNQHTVGGALNVSASRAAILAALPVDACEEWAAGKGADCTRLTPVFAMRQYLPEP